MAYRPHEYAKRYRNRAEELRAIAENTETHEARRTYLQLAAEYDALADKANADARAAAADPPAFAETISTRNRGSA